MRFPWYGMPKWAKFVRKIKKDFQHSLATYDYEPKLNENLLI